MIPCASLEGFVKVVLLMPRGLRIFCVMMDSNEELLPAITSIAVARIPYAASQ